LPVYPSGEVFGKVSDDLGSGIECGVAVCGHDHLCGAGGVCDPKEDEFLLSLGTTAVLLGIQDQRPLNDDDYQSGFSFGLHVIPDKITYQGGLQAAGSSVEWIKNILGIDKDSYLEFNQLLGEAGDMPGSILYFPFLSGTGAPYLDPNVRGAFMGLHHEHTRADIARAVIEGIAYELKAVMDLTPAAGRSQTIKAVGGGTKERFLMQTLANITNTKLSVPEVQEAVLLGAAMLPGKVNARVKILTEYVPNPQAAAAYENIYKSRYLPAQKFIRTK